MVAQWNTIIRESWRRKVDHHEKDQQVLMPVSAFSRRCGMQGGSTKKDLGSTGAGDEGR
jgi:hypothetical protein